MRIFISGATGVIGRRVVPLLVDRGYLITALARSREKAAALERAGGAPRAPRMKARDLVAAALGLRPPKFPPPWIWWFAGSIGETLACSQRISNRIPLRDRRPSTPAFAKAGERSQPPDAPA